MLAKKLRSVGPSGGSLSYSFAGASASSGSSPIQVSFNSVAEPAAGETRTIYIGFVVFENNDVYATTGCTIDGVAATQIVNVDNTNGANSVGAAIFKLETNTGTTIDVDVSHDRGSVSFATVYCYAVYSSSSVTETGSAGTTNTTSYTTINSAADDVLLCIMYSGTSTGPTEDNLAEDSNDSFRFAASGYSASTTYTPAISGVNASFNACAYCSIGPA